MNDTGEVRRLRRTADTALVTVALLAVAYVTVALAFARDVTEARALPAATSTTAGLVAIAVLFVAFGLVETSEHLVGRTPPRLLGLAAVLFAVATLWMVSVVGLLLGAPGSAAVLPVLLVAVAATIALTGRTLRARTAAGRR